MESSTFRLADRHAADGPVLILFIDGVGLGPPATGNPFADLPLEGFRRLVNGPLVAGCARSEPGRSVCEADATLAIEGLPQSATGQTALFTGVNAAQAVGRHVPAFPGPRLKSIIEREGLLARARREGRTVALANAFAPSYLRDVEAGRRRASVTVHLARSAGVPLRSEAELARDQAVTWDFQRDFFRRAVGSHVPPVPAEIAGRHLAAIAAAHDLTLYETFLTDLAGHGRVPISVVEAIGRVDAFLAGVLDGASERLTLVLCSDHGNVEEPEHGRHTRNPVPLVALGPLAHRFAGLRSIVELAPAVLCAIGAADRRREQEPEWADAVTDPAVAAGAASS
ncbi:MAG TPA: metalloenzyme [Thermoanaerobaculia bacterium]|nr:metalloenzyme [Thermoanaerobaculia bacterium]